MRDPNFYKTELYERERRKDEMRQAEQGRLARLARSTEALHHRRATDWLQSNFDQVEIYIFLKDNYFNFSPGTSIGVRAR